MRADEDGEFWNVVAGALLGAGISMGVEVAFQFGEFVITGDKNSFDGRSINNKKIAKKKYKAKRTLKTQKKLYRAKKKYKALKKPVTKKASKSYAIGSAKSTFANRIMKILGI